jgi:toxin ParE1/3/4
MYLKLEIVTMAVSLRLPDDLSARLDNLAKRTGRTKTFYMIEAITNFVNREAEIVEGILEGMEDVRAVRTVSHADVKRRSRSIVAAAGRQGQAGVTRRIAWSARAASDYHAQLEFISEQDPANADLVDQRIMAAIETLAQRPIGRPGRVSGTYEKTVLKTGLIVAYELTADTLGVLRIIRARRDWPKGGWPKD